MRAELKRKEELLNDTKRKVASYEQSLEGINANFDFQVKSRMEMNQSFLQNEAQIYSADRPQPVLPQFPNQ